MNKTLMLLVLGALFMAPLASAQDNRAEPNTGYDGNGALTPTASANAATAIEYFDMYIFCDTPGFSPREATDGNFICPGTVRYSLVWGEWTDANSDGCIGSCGAVLVAGKSTDGTFNSVAPVTRVYLAGNLNNDGNYQVEDFLASGDVDTLIQNEYRPIGPADAQHQSSTFRPIGGDSVGTNAFQIDDPQTVAWLDFRAPGQGSGTRCLIPMARGTYGTVEGVYTYVDDMTFDRLSNNGLGASDLGISGNSVAGVDLSPVWLGDDVKNAYNSSDTSSTEPEDHENDQGIVPTFDRFYKENLAGVLGESNQPWDDWVFYNNLERDGCTATSQTFPKAPEGRFVFSAGVYADADGDGQKDTPITGAGWTSNTQIIFSPVGAHPLGTLSNGAWTNTAYGYRAGLGGNAEIQYFNVAPTSSTYDKKEYNQDLSPAVAWYGHPVTWRDADCVDDQVIGTQTLPTHALLANAIRCA